VYRRSAIWEPAAVGSDETVALFGVKKGERVVMQGHRLLVAAAVGTSSTVTLGDGDDPDGYQTAAQLDIETATVGAPASGAGAYLAPSGGKVYAASDTVDAVYTASGATGTKPRVEYVIWCATDFAG